MTDFHWILYGGKLVQSVTSLTLANATEKIIDSTVPTGKRWFLISIKVTNPDSVNRAISFTKFKEAALTNVIKTYRSEAAIATTATMAFPDLDAGELMFISDVLDAGNTIRIVWSSGGASAGGTDADGLVIEYLEVDA